MNPISPTTGSRITTPSHNAAAHAHTLEPALRMNDFMDAIVESGRGPAAGEVLSDALKKPAAQPKINASTARTTVIEEVRQHAISMRVEAILDSYGAVRMMTHRARQQADAFIESRIEAAEQVIDPGFPAGWKLYLVNQMALIGGISALSSMVSIYEPLVDAAVAFGDAIKYSERAVDVANLNQLLQGALQRFSDFKTTYERPIAMIPKEHLTGLIECYTGPIELLGNLFVAIERFKSEALVLREIAAPFA